MERMISRYRVLERLGACGKGEVYKAFDTKMQRVALKLLTSNSVRARKRTPFFFETTGGAVQRTVEID